MHGRLNEAALDAPAATSALWNPVATLFWSVLFTPAFGAWIVMHNWRLLGNAVQARIAQRWLVAGLVLLGLHVLAQAICARLHTEPVLLQWVSVLFAMAWGTNGALPQILEVKRRYGERYARRAWDGPLVVALLAGCAYWLTASSLRWLFVAAT